MYGIACIILWEFWLTFPHQIFHLNELKSINIGDVNNFTNFMNAVIDEASFDNISNNLIIVSGKSPESGLTTSLPPELIIFDLSSLEIIFVAVSKVLYESITEAATLPSSFKKISITFSWASNSFSSPQEVIVECSEAGIE